MKTVGLGTARDDRAAFADADDDAAPTLADRSGDAVDAQADDGAWRAHW